MNDKRIVDAAAPRELTVSEIEAVSGGGLISWARSLFAPRVVMGDPDQYIAMVVKG